jgi:hypothetical protein
MTEMPMNTVPRSRQEYLRAIVIDMHYPGVTRSIFRVKVLHLQRVVYSALLYDRTINMLKYACQRSGSLVRRVVVQTRKPH